MTTAERLEARGEARGKAEAEGRTEERMNIAKSLIQEGADLAFVAKVTKLSIEEVIALKNQS